VLPELLRFGLALTGDTHRADELAQVALVKSMRRWQQLRGEHPRAYLHRAMVTANISWWRRTRREIELPAKLDVADARSAYADYDERDTMLRALWQLPPRQRAVLVLRYYDDCTEAQIADVMGCSIGTVKSQAAKAMRSMRRLLPAVRDGEEVRP
jgi:RNA polymerase sigma-70 factor (sigma-E family)